MRARIMAIMAILASSSCGRQNDELSRQSHAVEDSVAAVDNVADAMVYHDAIQLLPPRMNAGEVENSIRLFCERSANTHPGGNIACVNNARTGATFTGMISARFPNRTDVEAMISDCMDLYTDGSVTDFALVGGCVRNGRGLKPSP